MENENKRNNNILYAVIVVLVAIICLLFGFIVGQGNFFDTTSSNQPNVENKNEDNEKEEDKISYEIKENTLYVNGKNTGLSTVYSNGDQEYTTIGKIYNLGDAIVVGRCLSGIDCLPSINIIDKDAKKTEVYIGEGYADWQINIENSIKTKGYIIRSMDNYYIENNALYITSDDLAQDDVAVVCSSDENKVVIYTEKFNYQGNGKFSNSTIVGSVTAKEYIQKHNIKCN